MMLLAVFLVFVYVAIVAFGHRMVDRWERNKLAKLDRLYQPSERYDVIMRSVDLKALITVFPLTIPGILIIGPFWLLYQFIVNYGVD